MLYIGDMHCTSKSIDRLVGTVRDFIANHPEEQSVIFLGDFVYHFSYDRKALAQCFSLFIELYRQEKHVYVLAGNHDRISGQFVFHEGKVMSELGLDDSSGGLLEFITEPVLKTIEGQPILFLPFHLPEAVEDRSGQFSTLFTSASIQEQRSARVNEYLWQQVSVWKQTAGNDEILLICHHWYINNTIFPGQNARFSYRSPALSEQRLNDDRLRLISGHLHKPFVHKNYCCCGSVWSTSPLEINQVKCLWKWDSAKQIMTATPVWVNPYMQSEFSGEPVGREQIDLLIEQTIAAMKEECSGGLRKVVVEESTSIDVAWLSLIITHNQQSQDSLTAYVSEEVQGQVREVVVKQKQRLMHELLENLTDASLDLDKSMSDRQSLLKAYLRRKYGDEHEAYLSVLHNLQIIA